MTLKGHYIWGPEVEMLTLCGDKKTYWVVGPSEVLENLQKKYQALSKKTYDKILFEIVGRVKPKNSESDGFDADYVGLIAIELVKSA